MKISVLILSSLVLITLSSTCEKSNFSNPLDPNSPDYIPPPTSSIISPPSGSIFRESDTIIFIGLGTDSEGNILEKEALSWSSNIDGTLGIGDTLSVTSLSTNIHLITLTVTDNRNSADTSLTTIFVSGGPMIEKPMEGAVFTFGDLVEFSGFAIDQEDGVLTGESLKWYSDVNGFLSSGESFTTDGLSIATHTILFVASDSDSNIDTAFVSVTIEPPNQAPVAAILSPKNFDKFIIGETVSFSGVGIDNEDGELTGSSLVWSSGIDSLIGTGNTFFKNDLSENMHVISLVVTDSKGAADTAFVTVEIRPENTPPTASFTVTPVSGTTDTLFKFDATLSQDNETPLALLFKWDWEDDGVYDTGFLATPAATHMYADSGLFSAKLLVVDPGGLADSTTITIDVSLGGAGTDGLESQTGDANYNYYMKKPKSYGRYDADRYKPLDYSFILVGRTIRYDR